MKEIIKTNSIITCPCVQCLSNIGGKEPHVVKNGLIISRGETIQLYLCKVCGKKFSEYTNTVLHYLKTPKDKLDMIFKSMSVGLGNTQISYIFDIHPDTVTSLQRRFSDVCKQDHEEHIAKIDNKKKELK